MAVGFIVQIDWSQTDKTYVFVEGATTREQAKELVKKSCNCPRIYVAHEIDKIIKVPIISQGKIAIPVPPWRRSQS